MPSKRKRKAQELNGLHRGTPQAKRAKSDQAQGKVKHPLLLQYYDNVQTLREYLLLKLPSSSRLRRKKIALQGKDAGPSDELGQGVKSALSQLLDTTIIVDFVIWQLFSRPQPATTWPRHILCDGFRRRAQHTGKAAGPGSPGSIPGLIAVHTNHHVQTLKDAPWPQVLMLLGKYGEQIMIDLLIDNAIFLPVQTGVGNMYQLSGIPMSQNDIPLKPDHSLAKQPEEGIRSLGLQFERSPSEIVFMRNRMLYARATLTARGTVQHGLRHIREPFVSPYHSVDRQLMVRPDVLNRCPYTSCSGQLSTEETLKLEENNERNTFNIMMYMFPRQFGLHNAFTSPVDFSKTSQKLPDYTVREEEISAVFKERSIRAPKRLRGDVKRLVQRLQILNGRCAYAELLRHYCPSVLDALYRKPLSKMITKQSQDTQLTKAPCADTQLPSSTSNPRSAACRHKSRQSAPSMPEINFNAVTDLATPVAHVSTFCQTVLAKIIPSEFWGGCESQIHNRRKFLGKVDHFIKLRRFESMSLHEVADGLKVADMEWLAPPALKGKKTSQTDMKKRREILHEFLYFVFDSILIPLLRSNFYITESSSHRYRLFFFRHDVWRYVAEPAMTTLRTSMFEEVKLEQANRILDSRRLGFSRIRLLPKGKTMRPIMNLRRRAAIKGKGGVLGPSINSVLGPIHSMLKLETERNPSKLGSSMFSVGEIYHRLNAFMAGIGKKSQDFYFAKVDVQSAFDTIPQDAVIKLMEGVPSQNQYIIKKHVEVKAGLLDSRSRKKAVARLTRRWHSVAVTPEDSTNFSHLVESRLSLNRKNTIFVGNTLRKELDTRSLMALMASHIRQNLVKVGKKFYRQKSGIPQGSILSSALCNYFYADLETQHLAFLDEKGCLLMRLIDDFLLITTDISKARRFVEVMHGGLPGYGVTVNPGKTLTNFDLQVGGTAIAKVSGNSLFPYCGLGIDCKSLNIVKYRDNIKDPGE
ncbi:Telomerase reverse transcriptase 1 [Colletotrichum chlorophyti]|uniref:Telomerase reverse transcriptase n=1 Tax=Colletotrichum chlorophyti TaxID=708187 RepID=A0A1Q8RCJ4_9PEZI|nr:Telomerase reverse transcriptase 1 [Colletotrichum chlorophyti]